MVDYRKIKTIEVAYDKAERRVKRESSVDEKIKIWKQYLSEHRKFIPFSENDWDKHLLRQARKQIDDLSQSKRSRLRRNFSLWKFLLAKTNGMERNLSDLNMTIEYDYLNSAPSAELPFKVVDFDYDEVTFNFLIATRTKSSGYSSGEIVLTAFDDQGIKIAATSEEISSTKHPAQLYKKLYIVSTARNASKYSVNIKIAKNSGI